MIVPTRAAFGVLLVAFSPALATAKEPRVHLASDLVRVRRGDVDREGSTSRKLGALRGETVAFQIIVESGDEPLAGVELGVTPLVDGDAQLPRAQVFVEHYVTVHARSRNDAHPGESLGFTPSARPSDDSQSGDVPDALVPVESAHGFVPYPLTVPPRATAALWVDVDVPETARPGDYRATWSVKLGARAASVDVAVTVADAVLPYRPVSFFAYYDPAELRSRMGDDTHAELQLWQLLHRHHVDALAPLVDQADATRLARMHSGAAFRADEGYEGPGEGVAPAVVALGTYGAFGDPTPEKRSLVEALAARIPAAVEDVFLYAIDEQCESPRGSGWRRLLAKSPAGARVRVAHTCSEDPTSQDVDIVLTTTDSFVETLAREARVSGRRVWVYNGQLPFSGPLVLDAPPSALAVDGWIAATREVDRWFFWETIFWNDDNKGGRGPVDPFVTAENFHNRSGDAALCDGLLLYPGTQRAPFEAHSLGRDAVFPSLRLKMLRRGIEDAGYVALARSADATLTDAITRALVPRALGEVLPDEATPFSTDAASIENAREGLRALIVPGRSLPDRAAAQILREGARARVPHERPRSRPRRWMWMAPLALVLAGLSLWAVARRRSLRTGSR